MRRNFHTETDRLWFTSDLHFGHRAMIEKCYRPFQSIDEMDRTLITNWNNNVNERDHVFILGDVSFRPAAETIAILGELKGIKYLLRGNHDAKMRRTVLSMFDGGVEDYHEIKVDDQHIVLCHFAFRSWNRMHYGSWNLHGHSHGNLPPHGKQFDVGVDSIAACRSRSLYTPIDYVLLNHFLSARSVESEDHHQPKEKTDMEEQSQRDQFRAADETTDCQCTPPAGKSCLYGGDQHCPYFKKGHPCCDCGATVSETGANT